MKKILLFLSFILVFITNAQNGFTTYTTNLSLTGTLLKQTAFLVDNSGNKWISYRALNTGGNNVGLVKYNNTNWTLYNTTTSPALPSNFLTALAKDNSGNIWIGTADAGLVKFDGFFFTTYNISNGLPTNSITCIETIGSQVYVGTKAGLSRFDGVNFTNYNVANGKLPSDTISCIKAESPNIIWLGGYNRIVEFNINSSFSNSSFVNHIIPATQVSLYAFSNPFNINCIYIDSQNAKWLGSANAGILKYNGSSFQNAYTLYEPYGTIIPNNVFDIAPGLHNGFVFKNSPGLVNNHLQTGLTEITPNGNIYQYFYPIRTYILGNYIENDGANILISDIGSTMAKVYYNFSFSNYTMQIGTVNANNFKTLDINNVKAGIANRGDMHWDIGGLQNAMYQVPKGSMLNSNHASALWIGGLDAGNQLHGAAQTYRQGGVDFWPGPLDTITATIDTVTSLNYDKIWKVSYTDINTFVSAYNSGSVVATTDMLTWPAHGSGNNSRNLAPFVDYNNDGVYNPNDGDYPKIKGDQALYFIYNDKLAAHSTSYTPMGIEVQGMAYAYGCPDVVNGHNELTYTTFYDYKIINRSSTNYHDVFVSMWSEVDLGYYGDDYIGSNVADNYGYVYNGDSFDESVGGPPGYGSYIPAQGFKVLKSPLATTDGIDNDYDNTTDELDEMLGMSKFGYFTNITTGVPTVHTRPVYGPEFYTFMQGQWKDSTSITCGGNGLGGTINTSWVYTGDPNNSGINTDPTNECPYWKETGVSGDRNFVLSSGPFSLNAGQMQEVEYAFVTSFDSSAAFSGSMSLGKLKTDIQKINAFYNQVNKPNCLQALTAGVTEVVKQNDFSLYPNPAKSLLTISSTIDGIITIDYEVIDVLGKVVLHHENNSSDKFTINVSDLNSGIYFVRLHVNNSVVVKKFVKG